MKTNMVINEHRHWNLNKMSFKGLNSLRYSLAIIFIWFGILKPLGENPAADLVANTVFWFSPDWFVPFLGFWEVGIGVFFLIQRTIKMALILLFLQMPGTFLPLILLPEVTFSHFPYALSLEGQYIIKNLTLIAAAITIGKATAEKNFSHSVKNQSP